MTGRERKKIKILERRAAFIEARIEKLEAENGRLSLRDRREHAAIMTALALFEAADEARGLLRAAFVSGEPVDPRCVHALLAGYADRERRLAPFKPADDERVAA